MPRTLRTRHRCPVRRIAPTWLSSSSISFAAVAGETSAPKTVTLYNNQLTPLSIKSITVPTQLCCIRGDMPEYGHAGGEFQLHDLSHSDAALCSSSSGRLADDQYRCHEHSEHGIAVRYGDCGDLAFAVFDLFCSSSRRDQRPQDGYALQQPAHAAEHQIDHGSH
jgi:hypothetical protein